VKRLLILFSRKEVLVLSVVTVKVVVAVMLYSGGFTGISVDEFDRAIMEAEWAHAPYLVTGAAVWPPFHLYLNGAVLAVFDDPLWVPRATAFVFSCVMCVVYYKLLHILLQSHIASAVSTYALLVFHWHIGISLSAALDVYYLTCVTVGLYFAMRWLVDNERWSAVIAGIAFFAASGFHYQSWMVILVLDVLSIPLLFHFAARRSWPRLRDMVLLYVVGHAYIAYTMIGTLIETGHPLSFLANHADYSRWYYGGYQLSWLEKVSYYPKLLAHQANPVFALLSFTGLLIGFRRLKDSLVGLVPLVLGSSFLIAYSVFNVFSVPPTAAPGRFTHLFYMFLVAYAGIAVEALAGTDLTVAKNGFRIARWRSLAVLAVFILALITAAYQLRNKLPKNTQFADALAAGSAVAAILQERNADSQYLVELSFWDFVPLTVTAGHFGRRLLDREYDIRERTKPSIFADHPDALGSFLRENRIAAMAFKDPELIALADEYGRVTYRGPVWWVLSYPR
jgi:hypothetical protein